ncbi:VOC family protein [Tabrizicola sp.]|uniref:VOC family protein n=1 Tax=Tabrizicola sp. TaxID=2005166 RepID=UPI003F2EF688
MVDAPRIFPTFRYRDAEAALDWLVGTVGFKVHMRSPADGAPDHAELSYGAAMIMIGQDREDDFGRIVGQPGKAGGSSVYLAAEDVDGLYARVVASGAEVVMALADKPYGSREFVCRDAEGYVWSFGTYLPKA